MITITAHMDWDWLLPFPVLVAGAPGASSWSSGAGEYFGGGSAPAQEIVAQAAAELARDPGYRYSVCEMGFLRAAAAADPATFETFAANADRVHLSGAGITSPDSLQPHVEAFIRNYLVGRLWAEHALPKATISQSYVPDDFGHDIELPGTLAAMGIGATAFARLPGVTIDEKDPAKAPDGKATQAADLLAHSQIDFLWHAAGDAVIHAHWMPDWYSGAASPSDVGALLSHPLQLTGQTILEVTPGKYAYIGIGGDFAKPVTDLTEKFRTWNENPKLPGVYVALGSFDDFARLTSAAGQLQPLPGGPPRTTPYWSGCHATRPELKILHQRGVRALLAAEALAAALTGRAASTSTAASAAGQAPGDALLEAWSLLVPSTHHDYITGTAHPHVYRSEQLPLLRQAVARAEWLRDDAADALAALIQPLPESSTSSTVAVFNPCAAAGTVLAECRPGAIADAAAVTGAGGTGQGVVQPSAEGGSLFLVETPALGYSVVCGTSASAAPPADAVSAQISGDHATLTNGALTITLSAESGWGISAMLDGGTPVFADGAIANDLLVVAEDGGNEYVFAQEGGGSFAQVPGALTPTHVEILEPGPLRARIRATCTAPAPGGGTLAFVREYALVAGERFVRMALTGRAPSPVGGVPATDVVVRFPLSTAPQSLVRGTPGHWTDQMPQLLWQGLTTYASHHFTMPTVAGGPLLAVLHADSHAWGLWSETGIAGQVRPFLYGVMLRNTDGSYFGWNPANYAGAPPYPGGTDPDTHTRRYALLAPSACAPPGTGEPFLEVQRFATPPLVAPVSQYATEATPTLPPRLSFAATAEGPATVTAMKAATRSPATLVLRIHHPAPGPGATATVTFDPHCVVGGSGTARFTATLLTALEEPAGGPGPTISGTTVTVPMPRAIATIGLQVASA